MGVEGAVFTQDPVSHSDAGGCSGAHVAEPRRVLERAFLHVGTEGSGSVSSGASGEGPLGVDVAVDWRVLMSLARSNGGEAFLLQCVWGDSDEAEEGRGGSYTVAADETRASEPVTRRAPQGLLGHGESPSM